MLFRRKIYDKLLEWKRRSHGETALLIEGARRVGKSTVVEEFGRREYKSVAVIDFMKPNRKVVSAILEHPDDLNILFTEISLAYNVAFALSEDDSTCKVYSSDTGLMIAQALGD